MLKRIAILSVLLVYLTTSTGFAMIVHFCGKKVSEVFINSPVKKTCCKDVPPKKDKCCTDKHVEVKVSDKHSASATVKSPEAGNFSLFIIPAEFLTAFKAMKGISDIISFPNPPPQKVPLTVQNCVFRV